MADRPDDAQHGPTRSVPNPKSKQSLAELVSALPSLLTTLVKDEITLFKAELTAKLTKLGVGAGLIAAALFLLFFVFAVLVAAAVLGIATALPAWLAALIVAGALFVVAAILILVGVLSIKKGVPPVPEESITSIKKDINAVKGLGEKHE
ncbi:phage holin family protein [Subtercola frigoramans]|uniref:Fatty acid desaturase n=1 Tax=Subtercola frigoramans TaxID=120298 RepID=A0ABS2L9N8_9MICO|nr:phage holin family protein [Subtercola frigoramans]MBM7473724.1 fatty acid desaturase [Subtercola frigoramans]